MEYVAVLLEQTESGPEITGAGVGVMTTDLEIEESQPKLLVWVTPMVPVPGLFQ